MSAACWLEQNLAAAFESETTTAFRLAVGPGFWVERYGSTALISHRPEIPSTQILAELHAWAKKADWSPSRIFCRQLVRSPGEKDSPILLEGDPTAPPREVVMENGLQFEVDFQSGYNPGLFCDQRANRAYLRKLHPKRVLNTFAHTGAFSVAAARVGAETISVDISKSFLQRARRNFELNALHLEHHRFVAEDVPTYLRRLAKRGESFDAIILDPPTFGRAGSGKTFRIERDFPILLAETLNLARPGSSILLSTNFSEWDADRLATDALRLAPAASFQKTPPPPDFFGDSPSSTLWLHL
jgi:23S rRNA (cytosine1962-C5)-methyltransferase